MLILAQMGVPPALRGPQPQAVAGRGQAGTARLHRGGRPVRPCRSLSRAVGRAKGSGQTRAVLGRGKRCRAGNVCGYGEHDPDEGVWHCVVGHKDAY